MRGIPLTQLANRMFAVGQAVLLGTGPCPPCSRMDETLGPGGCRALARRGGITARIVQDGLIKVGSHVRALEY